MGLNLCFKVVPNVACFDRSCLMKSHLFTNDHGKLNKIQLKVTSVVDLRFTEIMEM